MTTKIKIDLLADLKALMLSDLNGEGYSTAATLSYEEISYRFFAMKRKRINPHPRKVHESRAFQCPTVHQKGYDLLKKKIENGDDLTPHQSKTIQNDAYEDLMLNDWNIHHFHLGERLIPGTNVIERTGPLLYALVHDNALYCVNIFEHGKWSHKSIINTIHDNWPSTIAQYRIQGSVDVSVNLSDAEHGALRAAGVNSPIKVAPGVIYLGPGGGLTTATTSIQARIQADRLSGQIKSMEDTVVANKEEILNQLRVKNKIPANPPEFVLHRSNNQLVVLETGSQTIIEI